MVQKRLIVLASLLMIGITGCGENAAPPPAPAAVKVAAVLQKDVPIYVEAIGQTRGSEEIEIRARVEGFIQTVDYKEGFAVKMGQLLYTIDSQPFEAALAEAQGRLAQAQADLARAHQDVVRYEPLVAQNAISRQVYETAVAVERASAAAVDAAKASVKRASIDLGYTRVRAPEAGLAGKTEVYAGTLVGRGQSTLLTHISRIDTIHVRFSISEREYLYYARRNQQNAAGVESQPDPQNQQDPRSTLRTGPPSIELILADGSVHPHRGRLVFVDRNVDPETGTILMEAAFPNPAWIVRPGQYARVRAAVDVKKNAILVPQRAVSELQGIYNVAVVGSDDTVEIRMVTPGERLGTLWVIDEGLHAGERIVVEGLQKVRPGTRVQPTMVEIEDPGNVPPPLPSGSSATGTRG